MFTSHGREYLEIVLGSDRSVLISSTKIFLRLSKSRNVEFFVHFDLPVGPRVQNKHWFRSRQPHLVYGFGQSMISGLGFRV